MLLRLMVLPMSSASELNFALPETMTDDRDRMRAGHAVVFTS
ncbi:MAG: hypothetical protein WKF84_09510 [Pyrinomonadaceae bacterium]